MHSSFVFVSLINKILIGVNTKPFFTCTATSLFTRQVLVFLFCDLSSEVTRNWSVTKFKTNNQHRNHTDILWHGNKHTLMLCVFWLMWSWQLLYKFHTYNTILYVVVLHQLVEWSIYIYLCTAIQYSFGVCILYLIVSTLCYFTFKILLQSSIFSF